MSSFFSESQIKKITELALEAGNIATSYFTKKNFDIFTKADGSKVTNADIEVSKFLNQAFSKEFKNIPIICEEGKLRDVNQNLFWLIDPIDGTSSFIKNNEEFAVSIALIENKKPIFGLIYAPLFDGGKMVFSNHENRVILKKNSDLQENFLEKNHAKKSFSKKISIVTSPRTKQQDIEKYLRQFHKNFAGEIEISRISSAIKFIHLVEGKSDIYLHFRISMEWDTAGGQALLEKLGYRMKDLIIDKSEVKIGENFLYQKPDFVNQAFVCF